MPGAKLAKATAGVTGTGIDGTFMSVTLIPVSVWLPVLVMAK